MEQPGIVLPLLGARTTDQMDDNLGVLDVELSDAHLETLDTVSAIDLGFPHNFLQEAPIRDVIYGGTHDQIINHRRNGAGTVSSSPSA
jgi:hypothetical protein